MMSVYRLPQNAIERGFTLLEVMVAVAILASGLTAVAGGIGMAIRSTALAAGYEQARTVANNQLALYLANRPDSHNSLQGVENGVQWTLQATADPEHKALLHVSIDARFFAPGGERTVTLVTRETQRTLPELIKR